MNGVIVVYQRYRWIRKDGSIAPPAHLLLNLAIGGSWAGRYGVEQKRFRLNAALGEQWSAVGGCRHAHPKAECPSEREVSASRTGRLGPSNITPLDATREWLRTMVNLPADWSRGSPREE